MNLSFLFASFGHEVHQVFIRKGFIKNMKHNAGGFSKYLKNIFQVNIFIVNPLLLSSYSILLAVSSAVVRDTSSIMVGQYFKIRRDLAEMWSSAGVGIGVLAISLLYFQAVG